MENAINQSGRPQGAVVTETQPSKKVDGSLVLSADNQPDGVKPKPVKAVPHQETHRLPAISLPPGRGLADHHADLSAVGVVKVSETACSDRLSTDQFDGKVQDGSVGGADLGDVRGDLLSGDEPLSREG